jgi:hypothetical protein
MSRKELVLNGMEVKNDSGPIITRTFVFDGFLTKEDLEGTEYAGCQIIHQFSPYTNRPETVIITESVKPVKTTLVIANSPDAE